MGILAIRLRSLPPGSARSQAEDFGRVLRQHEIQPQVCLAAAERAAARSGAASARSPSATAAHLQQGVGIGAEGHLAGGGLSLVGAAEGPDPVVDVLGAKAFSSQRRGRAPAAGHQRPPNRPPAAPLQSLRPATPLRWHPAGSPAEASHPPAGRSWGCPRTRFHGSGPGGALGQLGGGRVRLHLECYRRLQRLDGVASGVGARPGGGGRGAGRDCPGLAFSLAGIDTDNGSEFLNWHVGRWCAQHDIQFTRGRPYKKDDNAHIEQKNWTHVRKLMGWERYDTAQAVEAMNDLYGQELRLWMNVFQPSVKLVRKVRVGARLRRVYEAAQTPLQRVQASGEGEAEALARLQAQQASLDPFELHRHIEEKLGAIYELAHRRLSPSRPALPRQRPTR